MINDAQLALNAATAFSSDADATNVIDLGIARNIGDGTPLSIFLQITVAADFTTTDETYKFNVTTDDNAALTSDTIVETKTILASALTANSLHEIPLSQGGVWEQFLGLAVDVSGTTPTFTGMFWLGLRGQLPSVKTYPNGYNV